MSEARSGRFEKQNRSPAWTVPLKTKPDTTCVQVVVMQSFNDGACASMHGRDRH